MKRHDIQDKFQKQPLFIGQDTAFQSAIIIPLVKIEENWHVLLEIRSLKMFKQPGDLSFPGGKIDPTDESPRAASIRETYEELGVAMEDIHIIAELSPFITSPAFVVHPFVAEIPYEEKYAVNVDEVEDVLMIPLDWLMTHEPYMHLMPIVPTPADDFPFEKIANGRQYQWRNHTTEEWFYEYGNYTVWGLTARILKYFIEQLNK